MAIGNYVQELKKRMAASRELSDLTNESKYGFQMPEKPMASLSMPEVGSSFKADQAASLEATPTLNANTDLEGSGISSDAAGTGILAASNIATGIMKAKSEQQARQLKAKEEQSKKLAESAERGATMQARGTVGPLRELIASYRAALR